MNFIAVNEMNLNLIDWIEINDCCNGSIYCYYKIIAAFISFQFAGFHKLDEIELSGIN